jgi:hypothetical protein
MVATMTMNAQDARLRDRLTDGRPAVLFFLDTNISWTHRYLDSNTLTNPTKLFYRTGSHNYN